MKTYQIYEETCTIEEIKRGYEIITGLDNHDEFTEEELVFYVLNAMKDNEEEFLEMLEINRLVHLLEEE